MDEEALMSAKRFVLLCLVVTFAGVSAPRAQGAPGQIEAALADLRSRLGRSIALTNLASWRWEQQNFDDASMGCEAAPGGGGPVLGYQFLLTYNFVIYDYRVSHDRSQVILCSEMTPEQAAAAQAAEEQYSNRLCPDSAEPAVYMRSRIDLGMDAEAAQEFVNLRAGPTTSAPVLMQIPADFPFTVAAGPECADSLVWWYVLAGEQTGYVAEGIDGAYLVQPPQPEPLPDRVVLSASNIMRLQEVSRLAGNFRPQHDWSRDGSRLYLPGDTGSDSIWMVQLNQFDLTPLIVPTDDALTTAHARPGADQVLYGSEAGSLHLLQIDVIPEQNYSERLFLNAHGGAVSAVAFSPDGTGIVSAGPVAFTPFVDDRAFVAIVWDLSKVSQVAALAGHRGLIQSIAYSADGVTIVTGADDGTLRFWDAASGQSLQTIDLGAPIRAVEFSPDGRLLAIALASAGANVRIHDSSTRAQITALSMSTISVNSLAFSPDSSLLAIGATGNLFTVWDAGTFQPLLTSVVEGAPSDISFSPDGTLIAVSTDRSRLLLHGVPFSAG